ncbi:MAG: xanthine dehydrogenase FAD-binding subunit XdhB [Eubacteriales bacterium]|nr:xanthine dehydrogenase FAD-binding subunit XdhB [Eubacteriales bacterium]
MYDVQSVYQAKSVQDAIEALGKDERAMIVSGGTDVWVQNREGKHAGLPFVSIHGLPEITGVRIEEDGTLVIGAATCFTDITASPLIQRHVPMLGEAVDQVGSPQIRNVGTIGGNVCNGVTSADSAPSLFALDAQLKLQGAMGERIVPITEFYTGAGKTVRAHDEVLCEVRIPKESYEGVYGQYIKYGKRNAMEISTLGCAVTVKLGNQKLVRVRIAYGVAGPTPLRCFEAEAELVGKPVGKETACLAADLAVQAIRPRTSWRASKEFRLHLAHELCTRAMEQAMEKAGGKIND